MQKTELAHENQYFLDCAIDCAEISALSYNAVMLWGDRAEVDRIMNLNWSGRAWVRNRKLTCLALEEYALDLALAQPVAMQRSLVACVINWTTVAMADQADTVARMCFEDTIRGGAATVWLDRVRHDSKYRPSSKAARQLRSRRYIRRYFDVVEGSIAGHARDLGAIVRRLPMPETLDEAKLVFGMLDEQREVIRKRREAAIYAEQLKFQELCELKHPVPHKARRMLRKARRRVIRAAAFAATVLGAATVSAFASGHAVDIAGQNMILTVQRSSSLLREHGGCLLTIRALDGTALANLCCYFDGTPAIDQLAAFAMHMQCGEESTILSTGNLFSVTAEGTTHALIAERVSKMREDRSASEGRRFFDGMQEAAARYARENSRLFTEMVMTYFWHRQIGAVRRLCGPVAAAAFTA